VGAVYVNTDLVIRARFDLGSLHSELADAGLDPIFSRLWHGVWESSFESEEHHHPSEAINHMLDVVDRLSPVGLKLWRACISRRFNIGYQGSEDPFPWTDLRFTHTTWQFTAPLLQRMGSVNASFVVTIYPLPELKADEAT